MFKTFKMSLFVICILMIVSPIYAANDIFETHVLQYAGDYPISLCAKDFNGDGINDIVVSNYNSDSVYIYYNDGNGNLNTPVKYIFEDGPNGIAGADFNDDGFNDIAIANTNSGDLKIKFNNGDGTFSGTDSYPLGQLPRAMITADFNSDGFIDIAVTNFVSDTVSVLLNEGTGLFRSPISYPVGDAPDDIIAVDFDKDGNIDLAISNEGTDNVTVLQNMGEGIFGNLINYAAGNGPHGIDSGDFNNDGWEDFAVCNFLSNNVYIFLNNGEGSFIKTAIYSTEIEPVALSVADYNLDGLCDIAIANRTSDNMTIMLNDGIGLFYIEGNYEAGDAPRDIIATKLNNDHLYDLVVVNRDSDNISLFFNKFDPTGGLVAYYPFNGNANDESGNGNHATPYNNYSYESGVVGDAIHLIGSGHTGLNGGHILLPSQPFDTMSEFTIGMWVNYEGHTSVHGESFIQFGRGATGNNSIYGISYNNDKQTISYFSGGPWPSGVSSVQTLFPAEFQDNWHHLTLRVGNGAITGFLDGQSVGSDSYTMPTSTLEDVAGIGCHWFDSGGTTSNRFIGSIDDVRIYNRALSESEIKQLYTGSQIQEDFSFIPWYPTGNNVPSEVMKGGKAVRYYRILDKAGESISNQSISYVFNNSNKVFTSEIDDQGFVQIETPNVTDDSFFSLNITDQSGSPTDLHVSNIPKFWVNVTEREFSEQYSILLGRGCTIGKGLAGFKAGPAEIKTLEAGLNVGRNVSTQMALETLGNRTDLSITNTVGAEIGVEGSAGLTTKLWENVETPKVGVEAGVSIEGAYGSTYRFPDFFNRNDEIYKENLFKSAVILLESISNANPTIVGIDKLLVILIKALSDVDENKENLTFSVALKGDTSAGLKIFEKKNPFGKRGTAGSSLNIGLSLFEGSFVYKQEDQLFFDNMQTISHSITGNLDLLKLNASFGQKFGGDKRRNDTPEFFYNGLGNYTFKELEGEQSISVQLYPDGKKKYSLTHLADRVGGNASLLGLSTKVEENYLTISTNNINTVSDLDEESNLFKSMVDGYSYTLTPYMIFKAYEAFANAGRGQIDWQDMKEESRLFSIPFDLELTLGLKLGININLEVISVLEYLESQGVYLPEKGMMKTEIYQKDSYIEDNVKGPVSVFAEYINILKEEISKVIETISGIVEQGKELVVKTAETVANVNATVRAAKDLFDNNTQFFLSTLSPLQKTYSIRTAMSKRSAQSGEELLASTVGDVYIVNVKDPDGNAITEFNPSVELTISYSDSLLIEANIPVSKASSLKIYQWDGETGYYILAGGIVDVINKTVTCPISKPGQYILAIDEKPPEVNSIEITKGTATPTISCQFIDSLSDIKADTITVTIDGEIKVNESNYQNYFDNQTGRFEYAIIESLSEGEHTIDFSVSDYAGNIQQHSENFEVNTILPKITHAEVTEASSGNDLTLTATVTDNEEIANVFIYYRENIENTDYKIASMELTSTQDEYMTSISSEYITSLGLQYYIKAIDTSANIASTDPIEITITDSTAPNLPNSLIIDRENKQTIVKWKHSNDIDTMGYKIYKGKDALSLSLYKDVGHYNWLRFSPEDGSFFISVQAYDQLGNEGQLTKPVFVQTYPDLKGDINFDTKIDLSDVMLGTRIITSKSESEGYTQADLNNDKIIGIEEILYDLQISANQREIPIDKSYNVGVSLALTGPTADIGNIYAKGIEDYFKFVNETRMLGYDVIEYSILDDQYSLDKTRENFQAFMDLDTLVFLGYSTASMLDMKDEFEAEKIPVISASLHSENLIDSNYIYLPMASYSEQVIALAEYIDNQHQGATPNVALYIHPSAFGRVPAQDLASAVASGLNIEIVATVEHGEDFNLTDTLNGLVAQNVQYVICHSVQSPVADLLKEANKLGIAAATFGEQGKITFLGAHYTGGNELISLIGSDMVNYFWITSFIGTSDQSDGRDKLLALATKYNRDDVTANSYFYANGVMVAQLVTETITRLKANGLAITRENIKAELERINGENFYSPYTTVGPVTFSITDKAGVNTLQLYSIQEGMFKRFGEPFISNSYGK